MGKRLLDLRRQTTILMLGFALIFLGAASAQSQSLADYRLHDGSRVFLARGSSGAYLLTIISDIGTATLKTDARGMQALEKSLATARAIAVSCKNGESRSAPDVRCLNGVITFDGSRSQDVPFAVIVATEEARQSKVASLQVLNEGDYTGIQRVLSLR